MLLYKYVFIMSKYWKTMSDYGGAWKYSSHKGALHLLLKKIKHIFMQCIHLATVIITKCILKLFQALLEQDYFKH